jgi:hypothetical protein
VTPVEVYEALCRARVTLVADGPTLHLDGSVPRDLVPSARTAKAHLLSLASDGWRFEVEDWPDRAKCAWVERAAIREYDGNQSRDHAERAAFLEVREEMLAASGPALGSLYAELGAVLLSVRKRTG